MNLSTNNMISNLFLVTNASNNDGYQDALLGDFFIILYLVYFTIDILNSQILEIYI